MQGVILGLGELAQHSCEKKDIWTSVLWPSSRLSVTATTSQLGVSPGKALGVGGTDFQNTAVLDSMC